MTNSGGERRPVDVETHKLPNKSLVWVGLDGNIAQKKGADCRKCHHGPGHGGQATSSVRLGCTEAGDWC